jgi:glucan endo-1,3-alpha-glucosidase
MQPYTRDDWVRDIQLASSKGIDAFALNYGSDLWEGARIADAYQAALDSDTGFKLFLSPDFTSVERSCSMGVRC